MMSWPFWMALNTGFMPCTGKGGSSPSGMASYSDRNCACCSGVSSAQALFTGMGQVQRSGFLSRVPVDEVLTFDSSVGASGMPCSVLAVNCACAAPELKARTATERSSLEIFMRRLHHPHPGQVNSGSTSRDLLPGGWKPAPCFCEKGLALRRPPHGFREQVAVA